jgi:iron complex transport system substrate-binding protein
MRALRRLSCAVTVLMATATAAGAPPQRIVSLLPSLTESVCALGACARLVGVDRYSNWPESAKALPALGGLDDPAIERIVALKPDLILAAPSARATERLRSLGLRVELIRTETHDDVRRALHDIERLLDLPGTAAPLWQRMQRETDAAASRVPPAWRGRRVYFEVDSSGYAAGEVSFIGETLKRLGLANAVPASLGAFPRLNPEWIVRHPPDILMAVDRELATMPQRPGWATLDALKHRRTCAFPHARYELLIRPGPRLGEAAALVADCLQALPPPAPT